MLIVITIIGIVSAIAVPSFSKWRERQAVNSASKALMAHMKQARVVAMGENRNVQISFTGSQYTYDDNAQCATSDHGLYRCETVPFTRFGKNVTITPTTARTFSSRGTVNNGTIEVKSGEFTHTLRLNYIGRVYLE